MERLMTMQIKHLKMPRNQEQNTDPLNPNSVVFTESVTFEKIVKECWACISYIQLLNFANPSDTIRSFDIGVDTEKDTLNPHSVIVKSIVRVTPSTTVDKPVYSGYVNIVVFAETED
ncbi:hypothetical protein [Paenibacillus graminis]|uniref:hypothetical protein n=1 Tax=Paenibacillus graminis TaxID=189425 RepID=UPI002DBAA739|nr:hypothetical protein [Paenibacillus graminis]MEC0167900.1 hypothetical protein [Paenibacillus graminis]